MVRVAQAEKASPAGRGFEKHPVTARIRGTIGHRMLDDVNVESLSKWTEATQFRAGSPELHNFCNAEIRLFRTLTVKHCHRHPYLVGNLDGGERRGV
jgi:hypothetical protein